MSKNQYGLTNSSLYDVVEVEKDNDFIGFTFNNTHSSSLGIVRTSNGSRFDENLLPTLKDEVVQVPGGDGTYYFGSHYTQRQFSIPFAFDSMTEEQLRKLKQILSDRRIHPLIFDEAPYKQYMAKVTGSATLKHIPFNEEGKTIYKGEGTIQFTCYYPFAKCTTEEQKRKVGRTGEHDVYSGGVIKLFNPGDMPTDFELKVDFLPTEEDPREPGKLKLRTDIAIEVEDGGRMALRVDPGIEYIIINTRTQLVKKKYDGAEQIYNYSIKEGSFFQIPASCEENFKMNLTNIPSNAQVSINYDYLYF